MDRHSVGEEGRQCPIYDFHDVERVRALPFTADRNLYPALVLFRYGIQRLRALGGGRLVGEVIGCGFEEVLGIGDAPLVEAWGDVEAGEFVRGTCE